MMMYSQKVYLNETYLNRVSVLTMSLIHVSQHR